MEEGDRPEGRRFAYEVFLAGGPPSGFACPDNVAFDREANLWIACDVSSYAIGCGAVA